MVTIVLIWKYTVWGVPFSLRFFLDIGPLLEFAWEVDVHDEVECDKSRHGDENIFLTLFVVPLFQDVRVIADILHWISPVSENSKIPNHSRQKCDEDKVEPKQSIPPRMVLSSFTCHVKDKYRHEDQLDDNREGEFNPATCSERSG